MAEPIKVHLRDRKPELILAWRAAFAEVADVEISAGDIFGVRADAIVSPANSFGFMDGGIDLAYSEHFGWSLPERLQKKLREEHHGELPVGQAVIVPTEHADMPWMISAPTMRIPMSVADTPNAYLAFRAALREVLRHNASDDGAKIRSILCPGLATAIGRMPPDRCAKQMALAHAVVLRGASWPPAGAGQVLDAHFDLIR